MLPISKRTLDIRFTTPANLPYGMGSAFREVFGTQNRVILCNNLDKPCALCSTREISPSNEPAQSYQGM